MFFPHGLDEVAYYLMLKNDYDFQVALFILAVRNKDLIVPGYTHLQRAQPVLLPHLLLSYIEQVETTTHA
jgi:argininosuccinate lyase